MKAISVQPGKPGSYLIEKDEPCIHLPDEVKIKIMQVGICGTDREEVAGGHAQARPGQKHLVIGHEMLGKVVETGPQVTKVKPGDYAVFLVRRECDKGLPCCVNNRSDMCFTGEYTERGIKERDGYETEFVVDREKYLVKVPDNIKDIGVLTEPMSVASKAIVEAANIQAARLPEVKALEWYSGKTVLIAGVGAIGLLAAFGLELRGATIWGLDIVDRDSKRVRILEQLGGRYIDGRKTDAMDIDDQCGEVDFIFEAAGVPSLGFQLIDALGINGIYVMTGIPGDNRPVCMMGAELMKQMVLKNQAIIGSVNASVEHFGVAVRDLELSRYRWGNLIDQVITRRMGYDKFQEAIDLRTQDDIKTVIEWSVE